MAAPKRRGVMPQTATKYTRPKAKAPRQAPAPKGPDLLGDLGRAIGKIFPAGRSGQIKNAMSTYGKVGKIIGGK